MGQEFLRLGGDVTIDTQMQLAAPQINGYPSPVTEAPVSVGLLSQHVRLLHTPVSFES